MRVAFFLLTLILIAVVAWAVWQEEHPEWRHYQEESITRSEARLRTMLDTAREREKHYEVRARLISLDEELEAFDAGTSAVRIRRIQERLRETRGAIRRLRDELREEEARFLSPAVARRHRAVLSLLEQAKAEYAAASGRWPVDRPGLARLEQRRDSLADLAARELQPVDFLVVAIDSLRALESDLIAEAGSLGVTRDSLLAERGRLRRPVASLEAALAGLRARPRGVREIVSADGRDVARCPTCHGDLADFPPTHPFLESSEEFVETPCTVCHGGSGRALDVEGAHRGLLTAAGRGTGPLSLQGRMDLLTRSNPATRHEVLEDLRRVTGIEPAATGDAGSDGDAAEAEAWLSWWEFARRYFETAYADLGDADPLPTDGLNPWTQTAAGRPLRYVGSKECLACHLTLHREHCERWMATKFKSLERLKDEADPEPCYACHATGYDPSTGTFAEAGVTCEACHGPGERYSEMMFVGMELSGRGETGRGKELLYQSSRLAREAVSVRTVEGDYGATGVCVGCHHPRRHKEGGPSALERSVELEASAEKDAAAGAGDGDRE